MLTKFVRIRWLTRCTFKFSKWRQRFSVKTIIMNRVMDTRLELQWRWLQSYNEAVFFLFQATLLCNGSWVCSESRQENLANSCTATIYVYCNNGRRDCGCYCEIKPGHESNFQNIVIHSFGFPEVRVVISRLDYRLLA